MYQVKFLTRLAFAGNFFIIEKVATMEYNCHYLDRQKQALGSGILV
jgi:hypothetical protein